VKKTRIHSILAVLPLFILLVEVPAIAESEYGVKAVMLKQIAKLIEWPERSGISDKTKPFIIAVIGRNPFGGNLKNIYESQKQKIKEKQVEIRYISKNEDIDGCHLLFVTRSMKKKLKDIIAYTKGKPILLIADSSGFARAGVHINFFFQEKSTRFRVNHQALEDAGLFPSYHLLKHAIIINPVNSKR